MMSEACFYPFSVNNRISDPIDQDSEENNHALIR